MKTIYIYCEGPTEELFINAVLYPYFPGMPTESIAEE